MQKKKMERITRQATPRAGCPPGSAPGPRGAHHHDGSQSTRSLGDRGLGVSPSPPRPRQPLKATPPLAPAAAAGPPADPPLGGGGERLPSHARGGRRAPCARPWARSSRGGSGSGCGPGVRVGNVRAPQATLFPAPAPTTALPGSGVDGGEKKKWRKRPASRRGLSSFPTTRQWLSPHGCAASPPPPAPPTPPIAEGPATAATAAPRATGPPSDCFT